MSTIPPPIFVPPLIPECTDGHLSVEVATPEKAQDFRPDTTSYWVKNVLTSTVPGLVLGAIAIVCMCALIIWTMVAFCRCCCVSKRRRKGVEHGLITDDPFRNDDRDAMMAPQITYSDRYSTLENGRDLQSPSTRMSTKEYLGRRDDEVNAHFGLPKDLSCAERFKLKKVLCWSIILMSAATIGVSSWGIYASVQNTGEIVPGFWNVYGQVQGIASQVLQLLSRLENVVTESEADISTLVKNKDEISSVANNLGAQQLLGTIPLAQAVNELEPVAQVLRDIQTPLQEAVAVSNSTFISGLNEFRADVEPPTFAFQDTGRFVAIGVGFGLVILFALLSAVLTVWGRYPRLGSTSTILLWVMVALLMFLGVGLLNGVKYVTEDGCLYAESFVVDYAVQNIGGDAAEYAVKAINYYVDPAASTEYIPGQALTQIVDPLAAQLLSLSQQPAVDSFLKSLPEAVQSPLLSSAVRPETRAAIEGLGTQIPELQQLLSDLDRTASRNNVNSLYVTTKEYVCCSLASDLSDLYAAWVTTGVLALLLAILTTIRLVTFVREWYPKEA